MTIFIALFIPAVFIGFMFAAVAYIWSMYGPMYKFVKYMVFPLDKSK